MLPLLAKGATGRIRRRACNFSCRGRVAKSGSRDRLCARPLRISSPFHVDGAYPSAGVAVARSRRAASDAQRILHKLRALTTDNQAIPAAARNLLFFFLRPSVYLSLSLLLSPSPFCLFATLFFPPPLRCRRDPTNPPCFLRSLLVLHVGVLLRVLLLLLTDFPFFGFRLVRQGASSGTRGRRTFPHASLLRALAVTLLPPLL